MFTNHVVILSFLKFCGVLANEVSIDEKSTVKEKKESKVELLLNRCIQLISCVIPAYTQDISLLPVILSLSKYFTLTDDEYI